ncbi:MAG: hypothetical protein VKP62_02750 [Candidatus Sericytochromatia bacterium]|nr:hypothetical protein [Candidatus Sericytochromatia bacterium]
MPDFTTQLSQRGHAARAFLSDVAVQAVIERTLPHLDDPELHRLGQAWLSRAVQQNEARWRALKAAGLPVPEGWLGAWKDLHQGLGALTAWYRPADALRLAQLLASLGRATRNALPAPGWLGGGNPAELPDDKLAWATAWQQEQQEGQVVRGEERIARVSLVSASAPALAATLEQPAAWLAHTSLPLRGECPDALLREGVAYQLCPVWGGEPTWQARVLVAKPPFFWVERLTGPGITWLEWQRRLEPEGPGSTWVFDRITLVASGPLGPLVRPSPWRVMLTSLLDQIHRGLEAAVAPPLSE